MDVWVLWWDAGEPVDWFANIVGVYATLALAQQGAAEDSAHPLSAWRWVEDTWIATGEDPHDEDSKMEYAIRAFPVVQAPNSLPP